MTLAATVKVETLPDGSRHVDCWLCVNNFSVDLHIPIGGPDDEADALARVHTNGDGGS